MLFLFCFFPFFYVCLKMIIKHAQIFKYDINRLWIKTAALGASQGAIKKKQRTSNVTQT